jgi:hypothetical protein
VTGSADPESVLPKGFNVLGYAGIVPFVAGALGIALLEGEMRMLAVRALALGLIALG